LVIRKSQATDPAYPKPIPLTAPSTDLRLTRPFERMASLLETACGYGSRPTTCVQNPAKTRAEVIRLDRATTTNNIFFYKMGAGLPGSRGTRT
jgi:hypothetical protein